MTIGPRGPLRHLTLGSADWQELLGERTAGACSVHIMMKSACCESGREDTVVRQGGATSLV